MGITINQTDNNSNSINMPKSWISTKSNIIYLEAKNIAFGGNGFKTPEWNENEKKILKEWYLNQGKLNVDEKMTNITGDVLLNYINKIRLSQGLDRIIGENINCTNYFPKLRSQIYNVKLVNEKERDGVDHYYNSRDFKFIDREFENEKLNNVGTSTGSSGSGNGTNEIKLKLDDLLISNILKENENLIGKLDLVDNKDFIVALFLVYNEQDAGFSLTPVVPNNKYSEYNCEYYPDEIIFILNGGDTSNKENYVLTNTRFGDTLFEVDWVLKQLSLGITCEYPNGWNSQVNSIYLPLVPDELLDLGFKSFFDLVVQGKEQECGRYRVYIELDNKDVTTTLDNLYQLKFVVKSKAVEVVNGKLKDCEIQPDSPNSPSILFSNFVTKHYDIFSKYYPCFERLKQLAKLLCIAKTIKSNTNYIPIEQLSLLLKYQQKDFLTISETNLLKNSNNSTLNKFSGSSLSVVGGISLANIPLLKNDDVIIDYKSFSNLIQDILTIKNSNCKVCNDDFDQYDLRNTLDHCMYHNKTICQGCFILECDGCIKCSHCQDLIEIGNQSKHPHSSFDSNQFYHGESCFIQLFNDKLKLPTENEITEIYSLFETLNNNKLKNTNIKASIPQKKNNNHSSSKKIHYTDKQIEDGRKKLDNQINERKKALQRNQTSTSTSTTPATGVINYTYDLQRPSVIKRNAILIFSIIVIIVVLYLIGTHESNDHLMYLRNPQYNRYQRNYY